jgi:hypothetical protein
VQSPQPSQPASQAVRGGGGEWLTDTLARCWNGWGGWQDIGRSERLIGEAEAVPRLIDAVDVRERSAAWFAADAGHVEVLQLLCEGAHHARLDLVDHAVRSAQATPPTAPALACSGLGCGAPGAGERGYLVAVTVASGRLQHGMRGGGVRDCRWLTHRWDHGRGATC